MREVEINKTVDITKQTDTMFFPMLTLRPWFDINDNEMDTTVEVDFVPAHLERIIIEDQVMLVIVPEDEETVLAPKILPPEVRVTIETDDGVFELGGSGIARLEMFGDDGVCGEVTFILQIKDELEKILGNRNPVLRKKGCSFTKEEMERENECLILIR